MSRIVSGRDSAAKGESAATATAATDAATTIAPVRTAGTMSATQPSRPERAASATEAFAQSTGACAAKAWPSTAPRPFHVLSILAPVLSGAEGEVAYPGDPMSLYAALSVAVSRAVAVNTRTLTLRGYERACPGWSTLPTKGERLAAGARSLAPSRQPWKTDETIFDPRVWNGEAREALVERLRVEHPSVVLISSVSPAHRHALEIATITKAVLPRSFVVLGGRHADETVAPRRGKQNVRLLPSSAVSVIAGERYARVVDVVVSGDGYYALDLVLRSVAISLGEDGSSSPRDVARALESLLADEPDPPGSAAIVVLDGLEPRFYSFDGGRLALQELPSPYAAFPIRARFPVFPSHLPGGARTAHAMLSSSCRHSCAYCSESFSVTRRNTAFIGPNAVHAALQRILEYVSYGAEAVFFDDPIFCNGDSGRAIAFTQALSQAKARASELTIDGWDHGDATRLRGLRWGAQLTAELVASSPATALLLQSMSQAGCTYVYLGLESMADAVMRGVHKYRARSHLSWDEQVRQACTAIKRAGMKVGTSVLFGLDGETPDTIAYTIERVGQLIDAGLIDVASPNVLTYHPGTRITDQHRMQDRLDYHSPWIDSRPPYSYFEEAYPSTISTLLQEDDVWRLYRATRNRWTQPRSREDAGS